MLFYNYVSFIVLLCFNLPSVYAQCLQSDTALSKVYRFDIRKDSDEGFITTYFDAFDRKDNANPFEIIATQTSSKLMDMRGVVDGIQKHLQIYYPKSKLLVIRKEEKKGISRFLYQFRIENTTTLMLMQEDRDTFSSTEAEFPNNEFGKISIQKWQNIFWDSKW